MAQENINDLKKLSGHSPEINLVIEQIDAAMRYLLNEASLEALLTQDERIISIINNLGDKQESFLNSLKSNK